MTWWDPKCAHHGCMRFDDAPIAQCCPSAEVQFSSLISYHSDASLMLCDPPQIVKLGTWTCGLNPELLIENGQDGQASLPEVHKRVHKSKITIPATFSVSHAHSRPLPHFSASQNEIFDQNASEPSLGDRFRVANACNEFLVQSLHSCPGWAEAGNDITGIFWHFQLAKLRQMVEMRVNILMWTQKG